jgi:nucleotide-binding universal stress UspA family protein
MKRILIPIDGSDYANRAVAMGVEMARVFKCDVVLLHAINVIMPIYGMGAGSLPPKQEISDYANDMQKHAELKLQEAKKTFGDMADKVETVVMPGEAARVILEYVDAYDVDMVIMGSHGLGSMVDRLLTGSVTTKVLHHIQKPVLVVKS